MIPTDRLVQAGVVLAMITTNAVVYARTRRWVNPVSIISLFFFLPLVFGLSRLSGLQSTAWNGNTYLLVGQATVAWLCLPALASLVPGSWSQRSSVDPSDTRTASFVRMFSILARTFALLILASYLASNWLQGGTLLPLLNADLATLLHTEFPQGIRVLVRMTPAAVALLFVAYHFERRRLDLVLLLACFLVPLTRLSRLDVTMSLVVLVVMNSTLPVIKLDKRRLVVLGASLAMIVLGLSYLGNLRLTGMGRYEQTFTRVIDYQGYPGPANVFAYLYLAFPLSFENLDRFVAEREGQRAYGLASFGWMFSGLLKLNLLVPDYDEIVSADFDPVSVGANVPTALAVFFLDFGVNGAWIPMVAYMTLWWLLFRRSGTSALAALGYALTSGAFALASFQAIMTHALLFYQLFAVAGVFVGSQYLARILRPLPDPADAPAPGGAV